MLTSKEISALPYAKAQLLLLRFLNSSDLSFQYVLYGKATIKDIIRVADCLHPLEVSENFSDAERLEFQSYLNDLRVYCDA